METKLAVFKGKEIKKTIYKNEWWFVIEDVVSILTDSVQPKGYIKDMRRRDSELAKGWGQIATPLKIETVGRIAGNARKELEKESGKKVISNDNFLSEQKKLKE